MARIFDPSLDWSAQGDPISSGFDDVYYSRQNGLRETDLVFLQANNLPDAWLGAQQFTIGETGFGTGLNFLATWKLFEETAKNGERLDFISVEQFPMHRNDLGRALDLWRGEIGDAYIDRLLAVYPPRFPGFHRRWISDRVTLTLIFDEALRGFKQLACPVDAWFLDGFAPKKNPGMWQPELYREIARLSHSETTLGSFTAVGHVRRGLKEVGFDIKRAKGFGYKYHRTVGKFTAGPPKPVFQKPPCVTIIGAGIAGAACAQALRRKGVETIILDKNSASGMGASGNRLGLINPRIEAQDNPRNDAGLSAFSFANHVLRDMPNIDYHQNGALHVGGNDRKQDKLDKIARQTDWLFPHLQSRAEGLFFADAASVNPRKLVEALLADKAVRFGERITDLPPGPVILACGYGIKQFIDGSPMRLQAVRGQVTYAEIPGFALSHPVMFGHYIAPLPEAGLFSMGASFEKNNEIPDITAQDDAENIRAAQTQCGFASATIVESWAQIRTASHDRFPIVGQMPDGVYVSAALGSHGIQFGLLQGEILACLLTGSPLPVGTDALNSLSVHRFYQD